MSLTAPFPVQDPMTEASSRLITNRWLYWLTELVTAVNASAATVTRVSLDAQTASIATTAIPVGALGAGLYRVSYWARIARPATTSSSLIVTITGTDITVAYPFASAALTGNTTASALTGALLLRIDANTPITYATTYASVGGTTMSYDLEMVLEEVDA